MAQINPPIPTVGSPNSTEDQDTANALTAIVAEINGNLSAANLADGAATLSKIDAAVPAVVASTGARRTIRPFAAATGATPAGWQTITFPFGFTMASVDHVSVLPMIDAPLGSLAGWYLSGFTTSGITLVVNVSGFYGMSVSGLVIGVQ